MYNNCTIKPDNWQDCYSSGWGKLLVPAAYSHPAKMAKSLVFKIVEHALEEGWVQPGQWILDPFGGVGTTALPALINGLNYIGVELEYHFHHLGQGWGCPGFDRATWRRYHGRAQRVYKGRTDWLFCPDCAESIDRIPVAIRPGKRQASMFGNESGRMIPTQPAHRFAGNIERWQKMYPHLGGSAILLKGDSRNLVQALEEGIEWCDCDSQE